MGGPDKLFTAFGECMIEFSQTGDGATWRRGFAGDTFNTAWYFRRLAPATWKTAYFTAVGDDAPSRDLKEFIAAAGIDTGFIPAIANASPGLYTIELVGAERHFSYWRENSAARRLAADPAALAAAIDRSTILYFSGITLAILPEADRRAFLSAMEKARASGRTVAFDPNIRLRLWPQADALRQALAAAAAASTIVLPTFPDEAALFGDADRRACAERYRALGAELVVVKDGAAPCLAVGPGEAVEVEAVPVARPVDTTGAGDAFNGGFFAAWADRPDLGRALALGHETAARTICGYGALVA